MEYTFSLTYNGAETSVLEPEGWGDFSSQVERDFENHGAIYNFSSGTIKLGFADEGRQVLEDAFRNEGYDAVVTIEVRSRADESEAFGIIFTGRAIMKNRELDQDFFRVDFEDGGFKSDISNRYDNKVKIKSNVDLNGNTMDDAPQGEATTWESIKLNKSIRVDITDDPTTTQDDPVATGDITGTTFFTVDDIYNHYLFGYPANKEGRLEDFIGSFSGVNSQETEDSFPTSTDLLVNELSPPLIKFNRSGRATFSGEIAFEADFFGDFISNDALTIDLHCEFFLYRVRITGGNTFNVASYQIDNGYTNTIEGFTPPGYSYTFEASGNTPLSFEYSRSFDVEKGDNVYLVARLRHEFEGNANNATVSSELRIYNQAFLALNTTENQGFIKIVQLQDSQNYTVRYWRPLEVLERIVYAITGERNAVYSDFFGSLNDGYLEDGCGSQFALTTGGHIAGKTVDINLSLKDFMDWAKATFNVGWGFEKVDGAYRLRVEPFEFFYQSVEILDVGPNIIEKDTFTESIFSELEFNKVEIGYEKFSDEVALSTDYKDFLTRLEYSLPVSSIEGSYSKISPILASNELIQESFLRRGTSEEWKYDQTIFVISAKTSNGKLVPENDEPFLSTSGLDDSETAYNIRLAPVYMFLNHYYLVNSAMYGKGNDVAISNTDARINTGFSAQFLPGEDCRLGDIQGLLRSSFSNIIKGNYGGGNARFVPNKHSLTVALTSTQLQTIIDAHEGNLGATNYGYLTYRNDENIEKRGFLLSITWNPIDEIAKIETLEVA